MHPLNPQVALHPDAPYFSILLCLSQTILLVKWRVLPLNGLITIFYICSGEQEGIQKKTFTKWVNAQFSKV